MLIIVQYFDKGAQVVRQQEEVEQITQHVPAENTVNAIHAAVPRLLMLELVADVMLVALVPPVAPDQLASSSSVGLLSLMLCYFYLLFKL